MVTEGKMVKKINCMRERKRSHEPTPRDFCLIGIYANYIKGDAYHTFQRLRDLYVEKRGNLKGFNESWRDRSIIHEMNQVIVTIAVRP